MSAIQQEIKWCEENRGVSGKGEEFEDGFIAGLKQAEFILKAVKTEGMTLNEVWEKYFPNRKIEEKESPWTHKKVKR